MKAQKGNKGKGKEIRDEEADITAQDLEALGSYDGGLNMDGGDDDLLKQREYHFSADDLDVPGAELDDEAEEIGEEDEENNPYSLGGDNHEDLEEDPNRI